MATLVNDSISGVMQQKYNCGARVALFADSMTDWNFNTFSASGASFDPATNIMTFTVTAHQTLIGSKYNLYNRTYTSLYNIIHITVASIIDADNFTVVLPGPIGYYADLPTGALSGSCNLANYLFKSAKGWLTWLNMMLNQRLPVVISSAQSGDRTRDNLVRLPQEMALWAEMGVNTVVMHCIGINDLTPSSTTTYNDMTETYQNLQIIFDTIRTAGYRIIATTVTPVASGEANRATVTAMTLAYDLSRWLLNYGTKYADQVLVLDAYGVVVNPTDTTGLARTGYLATSDKIHLSNVGAHRIANAIKAKVDAFLPGYISSLPMSALDERSASKVASISAKTIDSTGIVTITAASSFIMKNQEIFVTGATGVFGPTTQSGVNGRHTVIATDSGSSFRFQTNITGQSNGTTVTGTLVISSSRQLMIDPLLQTTTGGTANAGGTLTATKIANNFAVTLTSGVTATADVAAASSGYGNEQTLLVSVAGNADTARISFKSNTIVSQYMIPGRTYVMEGLVRYTTAADWANCTVGRFHFFAQPTITSPQVETWIAYDGYSPGSDSSITLFKSGDPLTQTFHMRTAPITIPAGYSVASWNLNFYTYFSGTLLENLTIGLSQIAVRDITNDVDTSESSAVF